MATESPGAFGQATSAAATRPSSDQAAARGTLYCNPLSLTMKAATGAGFSDHAGKPRVQSLADPTVFKHGGKYYLYATGGAAWVSSDLVHWEYHAVTFPEPGRPIAPSIVEYKGTFYAVGNASTMYRSQDPLGPWESLGHVQDENGQRVHWADWMLFLDDDGVMYCYHNSDKGIGTDGVFVTKLDPKAEFARTLGPTINCFAFNPEHLWERRGEKNEFPHESWIEAPWLTRHAGKYYLQYSAPGTEYTTYAVGLYVGDSPRGPFTYDPASPILRGKGLLNGTGHHAVVEGPDGQMWVIYHVLIGNESGFERRLALDRVVFDQAGRMTMAGPTEVPQWGPLAQQRGAAGLVNLSADGKFTCDGAARGHGAEAAFDDRIRTWWEPETAGGGHWLSADLGAVCKLQAARTIFYHAGPFKYLVEASVDGRQWTQVVDNSANALAEGNAFDTFEMVEGRYVRLTITGKPEGTPIRVIEFTVFGAARGR